MTFANAKPGDVEFYEFDNFFHGGIAVPANTLWPSIDLMRKYPTSTICTGRRRPISVARQFAATRFNCVSSGHAVE